MSDQQNGSASPASSGSNSQALSNDASTTQAINQEQSELQEIQADPNAPPAVKQAVAKRLKSLKLKVDGREIEESLPFEIDDTPENRDWMTKQLQMSKVAQKRMGEKAQLENEVNRFIQELRSNPRKILADPNIGVDIKKLAAEVIEEEIANSQKSPEQLEKEQLQRELSEIKEAREKEKKDFDQREFERLQAQETERYDNLISSAIEKSDLPKSPYVVKKMADYLLLGLQNDMDLSPSDILPMVREEIMNDIKDMFGAMPEEAIEQILGPGITGKLRKRNIQKAKSAPIVGKSSIKDVGVKSEKPKTEEVKKLNYKQFFGV